MVDDIYKVRLSAKYRSQEMFMRTYFTCTEETPWDKSKPTPVVHSSAVEVGDQEDGWPGGDIVTYECPICGFRWKMELPQ